MPTLITDAEDTLIHMGGEPDGKPREHVIGAVKVLMKAGWIVKVWSREGAEHAAKVVRQVGIHIPPEQCYAKAERPYTLDRVREAIGVIPDLQFDDLKEEAIPGVPFVHTLRTGDYSYEAYAEAIIRETKGSPDQPRDEHGRWEGTGTDPNAPSPFRGERWDVQGGKPGDWEDTPQQRALLRASEAARIAREMFPQGARVIAPLTGATGTVYRHEPSTNATGGQVTVDWDNGLRGRGNTGHGIQPIKSFGDPGNTQERAEGGRFGAAGELHPQAQAYEVPEGGRTYKLGKKLDTADMETIRNGIESLSTKYPQAGHEVGLVVTGQARTSYAIMREDGVMRFSLMQNPHLDETVAHEFGHAWMNAAAGGTRDAWQRYNALKEEPPLHPLASLEREEWLTQKTLATKEINWLRDRNAALVQSAYASIQNACGTRGVTVGQQIQSEFGDRTTPTYYAKKEELFAEGFARSELGKPGIIADAVGKFVSEFDWSKTKSRAPKAASDGEELVPQWTECPPIESAKSFSTARIKYSDAEARDSHGRWTSGDLVDAVVASHEARIGDALSRGLRRAGINHEPVPPAPQVGHRLTSEELNAAIMRGLSRARKAFKYSPDQPRDHGQFAESGSGDVVDGKVLADKLAAGGFTVDPRTGADQTSGFAVSIGGHEHAPGGSLPATAIEQYQRDNAEALAAPGNYLGGWRDNGTDYLDVSKVVGTAEEATALARESGQRAFTDLSTLTTYHVTADGSYQPQKRFSTARVKYSPDQPRDSHGRFGEGDGSGTSVSDVQIEDLRQAILNDSFKHEGGGGATLNLTTGQRLEAGPDGNAVGVYNVAMNQPTGERGTGGRPPDSVVSDAAAFNGAVRGEMNRFSDAFKAPGANLGLWVDQGHLYVDAVYLTRDESEARDRAIQYGQAGYMEMGSLQDTNLTGADLAQANDNKRQAAAGAYDPFTKSVKRDVSDEERDYHGRWTSGGGGSSDGKHEHGHHGKHGHTEELNALTTEMSKLSSKQLDKFFQHAATQTYWPGNDGLHSFEAEGLHLTHRDAVAMTKWNISSDTSLDKVESMLNDLSPEDLAHLLEHVRLVISEGKKSFGDPGNTQTQVEHGRFGPATGHTAPTGNELFDDAPPTLDMLPGHTYAEAKVLEHNAEEQKAANVEARAQDLMKIAAGYQPLADQLAKWQENTPWTQGMTPEQQYQRLTHGPLQSVSDPLYNDFANPPVEGHRTPLIAVPADNMPTDPVEQGAHVFAAVLQDTWARSASDTTGPSLALQMAVAEKFGLDPQASGLFGPPPEAIGPLPPVTSVTQDASAERVAYLDAVAASQAQQEAAQRQTLAEGYMAQNSEIVRAYVAATYDATQKYLADRNVTSVELARGVTSDMNLYGRVNSSAEGVTENVTLNPVSSFSTDVATAYKFSNGSYGVVMTTSVPASQIFSLPMTGTGCLNEKEVSVIGQPTEAHLYTHGYVTDRFSPPAQDAALMSGVGISLSQLGLKFATARVKYSPDQERDNNGRFTSEGGGGNSLLPGGVLTVPSDLSDLNAQSREAWAKDIARYGVKIDDLQKEIMSKVTPEAIDHAKAWYPAANALAGDISAKTGISEDRVAAALSACSGRVEWQNAETGEGEVKYVASMAQFVADGKAEGLSTADAVQAWKADYKANNDVLALDQNHERTGDPVGASIMNSFAGKGMAVLTGDKTIEQTLPENKQRSFFDNIMQPGTTNEVTCDTHMFKVVENAYGVSMFDAQKFSSHDVNLAKADIHVNGTGYTAISEAVRSVADHFQTSPDVIQAAYWETVRTSEHIAPSAGADWPSGLAHTVPKGSA